MAERMPRAGNDEALAIINAFMTRDAARSMAEEAAARNLEAAPIQMNMDIAKADALKRLGIQYLPQELGIRDQFDAQQDTRRAGIAREARTHGADEQIRANTNQLETSDRLSEGRAERSDARQWGYKKLELQERDQIDQGNDARKLADDIARGRISSDIKIEEAERMDPLKEKQDERLLRRQKAILDEKSADQQEAIRLRGEQSRLTQSQNWMEKGKFYDSHPELARGAASGKVNMIEEGVVGIKPEDVVTLSNAKREVDKYEYLGAGQGPKGELVEKFRLKKPAERGQMVPNPSQSRGGATRGEQNWEPPAKSGAQPSGSSTPKSGDRMQKSYFDPARSANDAPPQLASLFDRVGERYDIDPDVLASLSFIESRWNNNATSRAGAEGMAQFMPATAQTYGVNSRDPQSSIVGMAKYLNKLSDMFDGNLGLAVAAYNWGEGGPSNDQRGVHQWLRKGADPRRMPAETRNHVLKVTGRPIEYWTGRQQRAEGPQVTPTGQKNEDGDDLFYVDVG